MALNLKNCEPRLRDRIMAQLSQEDAAKKSIQQPMFPQIKVGKRIRQGEKPPNKLEADIKRYLTELHPSAKIYSQSWRVRLANGAWFKVDHCALINGVWTAWECKGPKEGKNVARGLLALKVAAGLYPEIEWFLVWKEAGKICFQRVIS